MDPRPGHELLGTGKRKGNKRSKGTRKWITETWLLDSRSSIDGWRSNYTPCKRNTSAVLFNFLTWVKRLHLHTSGTNGARKRWNCQQLPFSLQVCVQQLEAASCRKCTPFSVGVISIVISLLSLSLSLCQGGWEGCVQSHLAKELIKKGKYIEVKHKQEFVHVRLFDSSVILPVDLNLRSSAFCQEHRKSAARLTRVEGLQ